MSLVAVNSCCKKGKNDMISSKEILEKTGLKNIKTLTRWYQKGLIPKPLIRTHPSGHGKMGYWPDWVLDRCLKIMELKKQGYSPRSAVAILERERLSKIIKGSMETTPSSSKIFEQSEESKLSRLFSALILEEAKNLISDRDIQKTFVTQLEEQEALDHTLFLYNRGYNPILIFDGNYVEIIPDFLVGQFLSKDGSKGKSSIFVPLLALLRKAYSMAGKKLPDKSLAVPAPKIWVRNEEKLVEREFYPGGPNGFEMIHNEVKEIKYKDFILEESQEIEGSKNRGG